MGGSRETVALMSSQEQSLTLVERIAGVARVLASTDLVRVRVERGTDEIEVARRRNQPADIPDVPDDLEASLASVPQRLDVIKADLVGVFHLSRPATAEGDLLEADRELAHIEALGIRHPVRSLGGGRVVSIKRAEGEAVEYGQPLFEIDRG